MISNEAISRLRTAKDWPDFEQHIKDHIASLDTVAGIKGTERAVAIEIAARQHAIQKLVEFLRPFMSFQERPDTKRLAKETANDAGLS